MNHNWHVHFLLTIIAGLVFILVMAVTQLDSHLGALAHQLDSRRYLDCAVSPAGDELLCKQVTVTDPPYKP